MRLADWFLAPKASVFRRVYSLEKTKVQLALVELDFHFTPVNIRFVTRTPAGGVPGVTTRNQRRIIGP